jgi:hypothetical protein
MTKQDHAPQETSDPHGVWRSRDFLAMSYINAATGTLRLSICRTKVDNNGMWLADITWDELQRIKRECGYGEKWAVEIFPADCHLVNVANFRHLWIVEQPDFAWVKAPPKTEVEPVTQQTEWPCQYLHGGDPAQINQVDGMCRHPECNPQPLSTVE